MAKAIDIFSGCGGVSCGLSRAGFDVKVAVELDKSAAETYSNYEPLKNVDVIIKDVCEVTGEEILKKAGIQEGELYLFAGCPPCQNFSMQNPKNRQKSEKERKKLLFEFLRLIEEIHPPFILMENVPGITTKFNSRILNSFIRRLENKKGRKDEKYLVLKDVLNAADYGVPQTRKRFVLHAVRMDVYEELKACGLEFSLPKPTHSNKKDSELPKWVTAKEAIDDLPRLGVGKEYKGTGKKKVYNHKCANLSEDNLKKMKYIRAHGGSRSCLPDSMVLDCHKKKKEDGSTFTGHNDVYGIMDPNKPAPTMTGGCLCYSKGRYGHYSQNRAISIREAARFQTFPDDFVFSNSLTKAALQIGNAVPVKLVEASAEEFLKDINIIQEKRKIDKQSRT